MEHARTPPPPPHHHHHNHAPRFPSAPDHEPSRVRVGVRFDPSAPPRDPFPRRSPDPGGPIGVRRATSAPAPRRGDEPIYNHEYGHEYDHKSRTEVTPPSHEEYKYVYASTESETYPNLHPRREGASSPDRHRE